MSLKLKDAICDYFRNSTGKRPSISKENPNVYLKNNIVRSKSTLQSHLSLMFLGTFYLEEAIVQMAISLL